MRHTRHRPRRPSAARCLIGIGTTAAGRRALRSVARQLASARQTAVALERHGPCWPAAATLAQVIEDTCLEHARFCCPECFAITPGLAATEPAPTWSASR